MTITTNDNFSLLSSSVKEIPTDRRISKNQTAEELTPLTTLVKSGNNPTLGPSSCYSVRREKKSIGQLSCPPKKSVRFDMAATTFFFVTTNKM